MHLPNGITGFTQAAPLPEIGKAQFKQVCFTAAQKHRLQMELFLDSEYPLNFYHVKMYSQTVQIHLLLNHHYPYLSFASSVEYGRISFVDPPEWAESFRPFYTILSKTELNERVTISGNQLKNENELDEAELKEIAFWKPERIGEIIFNAWD
ncbi:hypothetical protein CEF21_05845 [Bacillus sp. FJAT-42376]|uniref:hypothetical protein n=1 Tax=Bacillus sp. FJAT-42376 TaxID=2014076 RepID=UPI000F509D29|nr:hypothetical protein [Bacillus sp. FJAT-42376]AZB41864.1 hypothetical protein CEF21_05845 [Bacillus sp. FJAT-42376]